jgi:DNA-directed RNA polymerase
MTNSITDTIINEIDNNEEWNSKFDRQAELEEKMRGMGVDRFWSNVSKARERGQETSVRSVRRLMNHSVEKIAEGIRQFIEQAESGKAGRKHTAVKFLKQIEPEAAALITSRVVLDGVAKGSTLVPLARRISSMIEDELAFRQFAKSDRKTHDWLVKREKSVNGSDYRRQRATMFHNMRSRGIEWEEWSAQNQAQVGSKLIEIMVETTGLVQQVTRSVDVKRQEVYVEATPETIAWINEENNRCEALSPVYLPTIIPPRPWTSPFEGGYWTPRVRRLALVKTHSRQYLEELAEHDMPEVYDAVNAMQHTAWCVNPRMLEVVRTLWNSGSTLGGIPAADDLPIPTKPHFLEVELPREEWTEEQVTLFKQWKRAATDTYSANAKLKSLRLQFAKVLMVAEMFEEEEEIYFPHQFDFRGRCYAVPMFLNPQGSDLSKGLLEFANGVAITDDDGASWLAIHGSNSYGFDKVSLQARVDWVQEHEAQIIACAEDPYNNRFWADADKPFQFLAFCFEWADFKREGWGFVSTLPVQMDGSCNGLQNFSAMLRDPIGGEAVNLTPQDLPADIYQKVADRVLERVEKDAQSDDEELAALAQGWLKHGINRKVCKRPVMTLAYGAKAFGFKTQVFEDTVQPYKFEVGQDNFPWDGSGWDAASYMGSLIWDCVGEVVVAARQAMDWLQKAARAAAKEGLPVRWETPDGLVVLQAYPKMLSKRIKLTFGGTQHKLTVATEASTTLDRQKQANGISPNWVHSMDASHMRATIRRCWHEGIRSFSLIHDSYGTHAGNAWALAEFLREEFVEMYRDDVLEKFKKELELQLPEGTELEELPPKGDLDLALVLESDFFFA